MQTIQYVPEVCAHCSQKKTYVLAVDQGTVDIVKAIARFIKIKGINAVHPRKEMEGKFLTSNQVGNLSRARFNGLIAKIPGNSGNYCITRKGVDFLSGQPIPRFAVIDKTQRMTVGYYLPEELQCDIKDFIRDGEYWEGVNFEIHQGHVIQNESVEDEPKRFYSQPPIPKL